MIHHVPVGTNDIARSRTFYDAVLPVTGLQFMSEDPSGPGYGSGLFHFSANKPLDGKPATVGNGSHIAFAAEDRDMVDRFYAAAIQHGGTSDGPPGTRATYDAHYYGAFVRDPDGNKLEVVTYSSG